MFSTCNIEKLGVAWERGCGLPSSVLFFQVSYGLQQYAAIGRPTCHSVCSVCLLFLHHPASQLQPYWGVSLCCAAIGLGHIIVSLLKAALLILVLL